MNGIGHFRSIERFYHWLGADAERTMREYEEQRLLRREDDEEPADG